MKGMIGKGFFRATDVWFTNEMLFVKLTDGREVGTPVEWFPNLKSASQEQRKNWKLVGNGIGIHWDELPESIAVSGLLG
jgi:hypothetical protein